MLLPLVLMFVFIVGAFGKSIENQVSVWDLLLAWLILNIINILAYVKIEPVITEDLEETLGYKIFYLSPLWFFVFSLVFVTVFSAVFL